MKFFILIVVSFLSLQVNAASYYQTYCSSADATTRTADGHSDNYAVVTVGNDGVMKEVKYTRDEVLVETLESKDLRNVKTVNCSPRSLSGSVHITNVSYERVRVTLTKEGLLFEAGTVSASEDLKSVVVDLICELNMSSRTTCE